MATEELLVILLLFYMNHMRVMITTIISRQCGERLRIEPCTLIYTNAVGQMNGGRADLGLTQ